jgi:hypothetical protein
MFSDLVKKISPKKNQNNAEGPKMAKEAKGAGRPKRAESATAKHLVKSREKILAAIERRRESTAAAAEKAARCIESFDNRPKEHIEAATARPVPPGNPPRCACGTCIKPEALIQRRIKAADWKSGGVLAKIDAKRTELQGHLISGPFDKKAADAALRELEGKEAVLITMATKMTLQMTTPALTPPSLVYHPDQPPISPPKSRKPPGAVSPVPPPFQVTPQKERELRSARHERVVSREEFFAMELPDIPWTEKIGMDSELRRCYEFAAAALLAKQVQYGDYLAFQSFRGLQRPLTKPEFYSLSVLVLHLSDKLLDQFIDTGLEVSKQAYRDMKSRKCHDYRGYWPLGATEEALRVNKVDGCWAVTGYTSPFGLVCMIDGLTQTILGVSHFSTQKDPNEVTPPPALALTITAGPAAF